MEDDEATLVGPHRGAGADGDESTSTPKIAFDFWATQINDDSSSDGTSQLQVSTAGPDQPMPDFPDQGHKLEVSIPALPLETQQQYQETHSDVVERVWAVDKSPSDEGELVEVEFTDGTLRKITTAEIEHLENGFRALDDYFMEMESGSRKRKHEPNEEWQSESGSDDSDVMNLVQTEDMDEVTITRPSRFRKPGAYLDAKVASKSQPDDSDDSDIILEPPRRSSRKRQIRFPGPETTSRRRSEIEADDDGFTPVISDITNSYPNKRRLARPQRLRSKAQYRLSRGSNDSDIEFEQPRRSSRATRDVRYSQDFPDIDDDSFYRNDTGPQDAAPRVVSVRELFRPLSPESPFALVHMKTCYTCKGSSNRGQIVYCQGCSYAYHKQCIGTRSVREHLATKVGEADFVLQCRFCIEHQQKKEATAPRRSICQNCMSSGRSCAPFSKRQTARQEEKLREQNGGVDPSTSVREDLLNNAENVLFRCCNCHRAWHQDHLPLIGSESPSQGHAFGAFKDYSIDWHCNECTSAQQKIHRLVAWRTKRPITDSPANFMHFSDDEKEYLVKWDTMSYFHCTWMPGAWIYGVAAGTMKNSFAKRATETDLFKTSKEEAIPEEFLMTDIIFRVKLNSTAIRGTSKDDDEANFSQIDKVLLKFQGLGYDDVVWDTPPPKDSGDIYTSFELAYEEYLAGKYFQHSSNNKLKERIKEFKNDKLEEITVQPAGLKRGKLMGYQIEGLNWLVSNYHSGRSVILADEMGLGKTIQVVSLVTYLVQERPQCWPFLVAVPNATCPNWRREFRQWAPDVRVVTYHGGKESQDLAYKHELFPHGSHDMAAHVVIMSYDSAQDPRTKELFSSVRWAGLVVDEGQRLKNDRNLLYQALRAMKIPFRLLLTGTPLQNNKRELFNLIQFIDQTKNAEQLDQDFAILDKETLPKLHEMIRPYFLRRTKTGVLKFLPPMAQIIIPVTMTVIQEKLSKSIMAKNPQLIKAIFANGKVGRKDRGSLNNILVQLRKCLCHPFMYSEAIEEKHDNPVTIHRNLVEASAKLLLLEVMLPKLKERGHRVLIFSQFLQQLDIMEDFLNNIGYDYRRLDGQISSQEKQRRIDAFNAPESPIFAFLLSTRSGGVGINLATADTVIIMDPDFNPHQDIQALSRAHRIGQKRKVLCFQLMTKDTVEERIMQIGKKKMALDHALIESMDDDDLAGDDLESILKHGAQALFSDDYQKGAITYDGPSVDKLLDRSDAEQTNVDEEGSAEAQFSYAKVWANGKAALEDGLPAAAENEAPEPISSSVWDKILAEREEEARRHNEAIQEKLGRGGRRRTMNNYKSDVLADYLRDAEAANNSDSSDDFSAADAASSSSDEDLEQEAEDSHQGDPSRRTTNAVSITTVKNTYAASYSEDELQAKIQGLQKNVAQYQTRPRSEVQPPAISSKKKTVPEHRIKDRYRHQVFNPPRASLASQSIAHPNNEAILTNGHWNADTSRFGVAIDDNNQRVSGTSTSSLVDMPLIFHARDSRVQPQAEASMAQQPPGAGSLARIPSYQSPEQIPESKIRLSMDIITHSQNSNTPAKAQQLAMLTHSLQQASQHRQKLKK